jgi:8-oxo-dGTP diphosphatase
VISAALAWDGAPFRGAKVALFHGWTVLAMRRDRLPGLAFAGLWDLAGGGREDDETPAACALRELEEEFGLAVPPDRLAYARAYPAWDGVGTSWFFVAPATRAEAAGVRFGDEGECWEWMPAAAFVAHEGAIPHLRGRLADYLADHAAAR